MTELEQVLERAVSYPYMIWDMDGTILDSMRYWETLGRDYLKQRGITAPEDLEKTLAAMTMEESAEFFRSEFGVEGDAKQIVTDILALIAHEYRAIIPAKPFARTLLEKAVERGVRMCVLTTSDAELAKAALQRVGLYALFDGILTAEELKLNKRSGAIYEKAAELMGYPLEQTLILEDALYAVRGASETSAAVMAVFDPANAAQWDEIIQIADFSEPLSVVI